VVEVEFRQLLKIREKKINIEKDKNLV